MSAAPPPLVLGAAGFLGVNLVDALLAGGTQPTCARRARTNVLALRRRKVPMVRCDFDEPASLADAFEGVKVVYHLAAHYPRTSQRPQADLEAGQLRLEQVLDAAARAGVERLVFVSSTATVAARAAGPSTEADVFAVEPTYGVYHALKWRLEQRALAERRLEVVVACPGACLGPWDVRVGTSAMLLGLARGAAVPYPDGLVSWVDARDVAAGLVRLGVMPSPPARVLLSAQSVPLSALLARAAAFYRRAAPAPMPAAEAQALADGQERAWEAGGARPALVRELVDLIVHGPAIDASCSRARLGLTYRPFDETLADFDAWARAVRFLPTDVAIDRSLT